MPRKHSNVRVKNLSSGGQRAAGQKPRRPSKRKKTLDPEGNR